MKSPTLLRQLVIVFTVLICSNPIGATTVKTDMGNYQIETMKSGSKVLAGSLFYKAILELDQFRKSIDESGETQKSSLHFSNALANIDSAIAIDDTNAEFWFTRGLLLSYLKADPLAMSKATSALAQTIRLAPNHGRARFLLANTLFETNKFDLALNQFVYLVANDNKLLTGIVTTPMAICYMATGRAQEGVIFLESLISKQPYNISNMFVLSVLYNNTGEKETAKDILRQINVSKDASNLEKDYANELSNKWGL